MPTTAQTKAVLMKQPLQRLLLAFGATLIYDGTLTDDATPKVKNLGSLGATLDGTPTNVTLSGVPSDGMVFDQADGQIVTPQNVALLPTTHTYALLINADNEAAGDHRLWNFSNSISQQGYYNASEQVQVQVAHSTTTAVSTTDTGFMPVGSAQWVFINLDADKVLRFYKSAGGVLTQATYTGQTQGVGTISAPGSDLYWGNRQLVDSDLSGIIYIAAILNPALSTTAMQTIIDNVN